MLIWRITSIISALIFIACIIILIIKKYRKNYYYNEYLEQDFTKEVIEGGYKNSYFLTNVETGKYIKRYAIRKTKYDKAIICNFANPYKFISYYIICFDKNKKPLHVIEVNEWNTNLSSKVINLTQRTEFVNIYVKKVDDLEINKNVIRPLSKSIITRFSIIASIALFSILYVIRQIIIELISKEYTIPFLGSIWNYLSILVILIIAISYFALSYYTLRNRNCKNRNGGALEYEFF